MKINYIILRLIRHFLPDSLTHTLLAHNWVIRAGSETNTPALAVNRYRALLEQNGQTLAGKRVMVFGYGGSFAVGCGLLKAGAAHVILCDKYARPDDARNRSLLEEYQDYVVESQGQIKPDTRFITVLTEDVLHLAEQGSLPPVDLVLSTHVFEHLVEVDAITQALAALTTPGGYHLHYIDLRDHFFRYPFEMVTFSDQIWRRWLNPGSNLNRYRVKDYRQVFQKYFQQVDITILERDRPAFERARSRICPEFLSGEPEIDAATQILILAKN